MWSRWVMPDSGPNNWLLRVWAVCSWLGFSLSGQGAETSVRSLPALVAASWGTPGNLVQIAGWLGFFGLVAVAWAVALRRRVRAQTALIRERLERETALEAHYRLIWENSVDGMRLTDDQGTMVKVNQAFCKLVAKPREELEGQLLTIIYAAEKRDRILHGYVERFRARNLDPQFQRKMTLWNGRAAWFEVSSSFFESQGQPPLVLNIFRDVTERRHKEQERLALERKLLATQKLESLGVMAGGIAHDFNNLLTTILGNASLAAMDVPADSPLRVYLQQIEVTVLQAANLCKQMLAYSGRGHFQMQQLDLTALLSEMRPLLLVSRSKNAELRFELEPAIPAVKADPTQMRQVVMNLATNASEAIGERPGLIIIRSGVMQADRDYLAATCLSPDLPAGRYAFLEVADTGCGMSPEIQKRVFEPFFTTKFTGRGLGLAAVLGIVRGHKGALKIESELGCGTTFRVLFPAVDASAETLSRFAPDGSVWRPQGTVLVVDDEPGVRSVTELLLRKWGFEVLQAHDGQVGVEVFRENANDIAAVMLDLTMPNLNGEDACRHIRQLRPSTPVILMSGYTELDATRKFVGLGLAGFIQKPFKPDELQEKLRRALEPALRSSSLS